MSPAFKVSPITNQATTSVVYEQLTAEKTNITPTAAPKNEYVNTTLEDSLVNCNAYLPRDSAFSFDKGEDDVCVQSTHVYQNARVGEPAGNK